jgi:16S rRNA (guanine966-N2)-methyltransferase
VRESLFNVLQGGKYGNPIEHARVLDLYAGPGALGVEALSRGAAYATFVDNGKVAQKLIIENISKCKRGPAANLLNCDVTQMPDANAPCGLIFADPPYGQGLGPVALRAARATGWIADDALIVLEDNVALPAPPGFRKLDQRRYGDTWITLLELKK